MRRMNVSCESLPRATPSRSAFNARSRSASERRAGYVWNSKDDVTFVIVGQCARGVQKTGKRRPVEPDLTTRRANVKIQARTADV